jgi:hypothetical protein
VRNRIRDQIIKNPFNPALIRCERQARSCAPYLDATGHALIAAHHSVENGLRDYPSRNGLRISELEAECVDEIPLSVNDLSHRNLKG